MPTYEYRCDACEKTFERFQSITAAPIRKCPYCNKSQVRRLISGGAGLLFKGSGFYITDYRSESYKSAARSEAPAKTETPAKKETPAAKSEPAAKSGKK